MLHLMMLNECFLHYLHYLNSTLIQRCHMATYIFFHSGTVLPCGNIEIFSIYSKTMLDNVDL